MLSIHKLKQIFTKKVTRLAKKYSKIIAKTNKRFPILRKRPVRYGILAGIFIIISAEIAMLLSPFMSQTTYALGPASSLLSPINQSFATLLKYDAIQGSYSFNNGKSLPTSESIRTGAQLITVSANQDAKKGVTVSDPVNRVDFKLTPKFGLLSGKQDGNRIVYPLTNGSGWVVYTMQGTGVKEDIVLTHSSNDSSSFEYELGLGDGLEARVESDGSIGVYGNTLLSSSVATGSDADAALLQKARQNAAKDTYLFGIPKPVIIEKNKKVSQSAIARYTLVGNTLKVNVEGLKGANYPLSIDPSIYVATAQQFMQGNNETNINFNVEDQLIEKAHTTGARFNDWNATLNLNTTLWRQGAAAAGGYIYTVGGTHPNGGSVSYTSPGTDTFAVPTGITSITVKSWGGGGGGAGGGSSGPGGNGGGSGYVSSTITVTPGESLSVLVGGGGAGGSQHTNSGDGGGGGGYSSVNRGSTSLIIAAGGAGGGGGDNSSSTPGGAGGAGGGTSGVSGSASSSAGGGGSGSSSSGGSAGTGGLNNATAGSSKNGGSGADGRTSQGADGSGPSGGTNGGAAGGLGDIGAGVAGGGGGGSGYFGGGGGSASASGNAGGGGGGGGSSFATGSSITNTAGTGTTPGNSADSDRGSGGQGGNGGSSNANGSSGNGGTVLITYSAGGLSTLDTVSWAKFNTSTGNIESTNPGNGACSGWCTSTAYNLPAPRASLSVVAYNGFLYAIGGEDAGCTTGNGTGDGGVCKTVYVSKIGANGEPRLWHPTDTNKNNWSYWYRDTDLNVPRSFTSAIASNNHIYLLGGKTSSGGTPSITNSIRTADIVPTGTLGNWSTSATTLPYNLYSHDAQVYNDRLYIIGGSSSIGGTPLSSVYYSKLNSSGTLNSWVQTTGLTTGVMSNGGSYSTVWGGYIYVTGGCSAVNGSGNCTSLSSITQLASINTDGSVGRWNINGTLSADSRMGHNLVAWRNYIYEIGGCTSQNSTSGICTSALNNINYGIINQDGDASTVDQSVSGGTSPCVGSSPYGCDTPSSAIGNVLNGTAIINGYLYVMGGCTNNACSNVSNGVTYVAIDSDGSLVRPSTCNGSYVDSYCISPNSLPSSVAAPGVTTFNNRIYVVGGFPSVNSIYYATVSPSDGSLSSWQSASLTSIGATNVSYTYAYSRASPSTASTIPGNLYIIGGCTSPTAVGCGSYTDAVYKCNISTTGVPSGCSTSGQLQVGTITGASSAGIGAQAGTVYANYIYLIGGLAPNLTDMDTVRYAKFDDNNNIVTVGSGWVESPNKTSTGRRRGAAFGYNGYLYVTGGYDGTGGGGVLADIEFTKIDVTNGSIAPFSISAVTINQRWGLSVPVSNSYAYVVGGCTAGAAPSSCTTRTNTVQTFQIYNNDSGAPASFNTAANNYSTNRYGAGSVILNGYIYVAGGCTSSSDCTDATNSVQYAPIDAYGNIGTWSAAANLPADRAWGQLETAGGSLYYVGGQDDTATNEQSTVYYATPSSGNISSWSTASNGLPSARTQLSSTVWNDRIYVTGGLDSAASPTNTVYISPQLNSGGNITSSWSSNSDVFDVTRSGHTLVAYANNLYVLGGYDGSNYLNDVQFTQINGDGTVDPWTFSTSLPETIRQADGFARNGYIYLIGGRTSDSVCESNTLIAPISANTTIESGNNPTGVGVWFETNQRYSGKRYGASTAYNDGKAYILGGVDCNSTSGTTYTSGSNTFVVPAGVTSITVKSWGAGGGGGGGSTNGDGGAGGGGGYTETTLAVTPGESLTVAVGSGGGLGDFSTGSSGSSSGDGAGGGGRTSIYRGATLLLNTGGGAGGGGGDNSSSTAGGNGGAGGGNTGATGGASSNANGGTGGTSSSGGSGGSGGNNDGSNGGSLTGGDGADGLSGQGSDGSKGNGGSINGGSGGNGDQNANGYGGGGGGGNGYYGGGGGAGSQAGDAGGGGGGGGSNYLTGTSTTSSQGSGSTPANSSDPDRGSSGNGGSGGSTNNSGTPGSNGKIILQYTSSFTPATPVIQKTALLSQPQLASYSVMIDTDSDVFPTKWLLNGVDNSIGAFWQLKYQSMTNTTTLCTSPAMTTWGTTTNFGSVTLGLPGTYTPLNGSGVNTNCARFYYFNIAVDSTQAYGYPDDVTRGPTVSDLTLQFTADPSKRLLHGRTFTGGLQQPVDTPYYPN